MAGLCGRLWLWGTCDLGLRFLAEAGTRGTAFLLAILLSWMLGAAEFGAYAQITSLAMAFVPVLSMGLAFTLVRRLAGQLPDLASFQTLRFVLIIITSLAGVEALGLWCGQAHIRTVLSVAPEHTHFLPMFVPLLSWVAAVEAIQQEYCRALGLVRRSLVQQLGVSFSHLIMLGALLLIGQFSLYTVILVMLVSKGMWAVILLRQAYRDIAKYPMASASFTLTTCLGGLPFMLAGLAEWGGNLGDRLIVGNVLGAVAVAEYAATLMLLSLIVAIGAPFWWLLFPAIAKAVNAGKAPEPVVRHYSMLFMECALPLLGLLVVVADTGIALMINQDHVDVMLVMLLSGLAIVINQMTTGHEYYMVTVSGGKRLMGITLGCVSLGFVCSMALAQIWGLPGVALGVLLGKVLLAMLCMQLAWRNGFVGLPWRPGQSLVILSLVLMAAVTTYGLSHIWFVDAPHWQRMLSGVLCFVLTYGGLRLAALRRVRIVAESL